VDDLKILGLELLTDAPQEMGPQDLVVGELKAIELEELDVVSFNDFEIHGLFHFLGSGSFFRVERLSVASRFESFGFAPDLDETSLLGASEIKFVRVTPETGARVADASTDIMLVVGVASQERASINAQNLETGNDFSVDILDLESNFERTFHQIAPRKRDRSEA